MASLRTAMLKYYNAQLLELDREMSSAERTYMYNVEKNSTGAYDITFFESLLQYTKAKEEINKAKKQLFERGEN